MSLFNRLITGRPVCRWVLILAGGLCAMVGQSAHANTDAQCKQLAPGFPSRTITMVVGFPPGGQSGQIARMMADALTARLGQSVIVDSRSGAGGTIGAAVVAKAPADGYTLFMATMGTHAINASLYPKLPYDHLRDFRGVAYVINAPNVFVARASSPVKTMGELQAEAKANARNINIALPGSGTSPHLSSALFESMAGIQMQGVQYRGNAPALVDVLGGQVEFMVDSVTTALPHIQRGDLRALGVTTATRSPLLPNVPTVGETIPGYEVSAWWGVVAPAGTPNAVVDRINCETNLALKDPKLVDRFKEMGAVTQPMTPEQFNQLIAQDTTKWARVIKAANIKLD